jgi:hypothetical protein
LPDFLYFDVAQGSSAQPLANIGQPNQLAAYLAMAIPASLFLTADRRRSRIAAGLIFIFSIGIALTASRMGALMAALLCAWCAFAPWLVQRYKSARWLIAASVLVGYFAGLFLGPQLAVGGPGGVSVLQRLAVAAYGDRLTMWSEAVQIALRHPALGVGAGQYVQAQYWIAEPGTFAIGTPYAHNAVLQFAAEFGLPIAIAFAALSGWWLLRNLPERLVDPVQATIWALGVLFFLHAMLEWSLWILFVSVPVVILFAMAEPAPQRGKIDLDPRVVLAPIGLAGMLYLPLLYADFDSVAEAGSRLYFQQRSESGPSLDAVVGVAQIGTATYFKPYADRFLLSASLIKVPIEDELLDRTKRVLLHSPDVETISAYISVLALKRDVYSALPHVERLKVFAVTRERYREAEEQILRRIAREDGHADPLRERLRVMRQLD